MPRPDADEINTLGNGRIFMQWCGPGANNTLKYAGYDTQYLALEGVNRQGAGGVTSIRVPSPSRPKTTQVVGYMVEAPGDYTATLRATEKHGSIPFQWGPMDKPFNLYVVRGICERLDDPQGWTDFVEIYSYARVTEGDLGARTPTWDNDDMTEGSLSLVLFNTYAIGSMAFGYKGTNETNTEVIDVVYGNTRGCADCGLKDLYGTNRWYAVTIPGIASPGLLPELIYTVDGGATISQKSIENLGAAEIPLAIDIVGNYVVVLGADAYYYAPINNRTGVVGTFTKVSTGFNATYTPNDMFVVSPREIYFAADGGYIYKSTNILNGVSYLEQGNATSSDLHRVYAQDDIILAVGESGAIIISENRGASFSLSPTTPCGMTYEACAIQNGGKWFVGTGTGDGRFFYTTNYGNTWTQIVIPSSNGVYDIAMPTEEVIHVAFATSTPVARIYSSYDGGNNWCVSSDSTQRRMLNMPTFARPNRLAYPDVQDASIMCNNLAIAGLASGSADGVVVIGSAQFH